MVCEVRRGLLSAVSQVGFRLSERFCSANLFQIRLTEMENKD
jgi:hypothetical protein